MKMNKTGNLTAPEYDYKMVCLFCIPFETLH